MSYRDVVINDGATAYWRLDETAPLASPFRATDETGNYHGTYTNNGSSIDSSFTLGEPSLVQDGTSVDFVWDGEPIILPDIPFTYPETWSIEAWFKTDATSARRIFARGDGAGNVLALQTLNNKVRCIFGQGTVGSGLTISDELSYTPNTNCHVVATFANGIHNIYLNGVAGTPVSSDQNAWSGALISRIGARPVGSSETFHGLIDEVALYDGVELTQTQITNHYDVGINGGTSGGTPSVGSTSRSKFVSIFF